MVYQAQPSSNQTVQNAVFDYLNLNRHKFDQHGNFAPTPDSRDYAPLHLARWNRAGPPERGSEWNWDYFIQPRRRLPEAQSASELRQQMLTPMTEEDEERWEKHQKMADRGELTPKQCQEEYAEEVERCSQRWNGRTFTACKQRAGDRLRDCRQNKRYTVKEWGWADLDIPEIEKEEFRKRFGKQEGQKYEEGSAPDSHEAPALAQSGPSAERNPYVFSPPWGSPTIYRAPLMPPELQRQISWNLGVHIPPERMIRILAAILSRGQMARSGPIRGGVNPPVQNLRPILKGAPQ
jgi:hypothetical protein